MLTKFKNLKPMSKLVCILGAVAVIGLIAQVAINTILVIKGLETLMTLACTITGAGLMGVMISGLTTSALYLTEEAPSSKLPSNMATV